MRYNFNIMLVFYGAENEQRGFSMVELVLVMVIIGLLAGLSFSIIRSYQYSGEDSERRSDVESIARAFETYYTRSIGPNGATYPSTVTATNTTLYSDLFRGSDKEITRAPKKDNGTSIVAASSISQPQSPTTDQYIYQPFTADSALCTNSAATPCVRFTIFYRLKDDNTVVAVESLHQQ